MLFGKKRNPETAKEEPDYYLTVAEAASYLAGLQGRRPYNPGTIRGWLQSGELEGDQEEDGGRWRVKLSELKRWAAEKGIATDAEEPEKPTEAATPQANPTEIPAKEAEPAAGKQAGRFKLVPLDDEEDEDFAIAECPSCGAEVPVSSASVVVECPECGVQLQVLNDEGEEGEEEPDGDQDDEQPAEAPAAPAPAEEVRTNPSFMGVVRWGRKGRRG